MRHRRVENRIGPSPANDYTSGYGKRRSGLFGWLRGRRNNTGFSQNPNALPEHTHPDQVRDSYATEQTRVGGASTDTPGVHKYVEPGYVGAAHQTLHKDAPVAATPATAHFPTGNYNYEDGVYDRA